ncbi:MAG: OmpA family protein [Myxococcales bacterium]|nr:OmpA family protein [Myxococcales bacterium]
MRHHKAALALFITLLCVGKEGVAQSGVNVQSFYPQPAQTENYLSQPAAGTLEHLDWEIGLMLHFADDQLVETLDGERVRSLIHSQLTADLMGAIGLFDRLELGLALPVVLYQNGDDTDVVNGFDPTAADLSFGDIRLLTKVNLYNGLSEEDPTGIPLALSVDWFIPSGDQADFQGEGFRVFPLLALDYTLAGNYRIGANLGYMVRPQAEFLNLEVNDQLTWAISADLPVADSFHIVPEVFGAVGVLADEQSSEETPVELLLAGRYFINPSLMAQAGFGFGLVKGVGSPDYRLLLGIAYSPVNQDMDSDGDGLMDSVDACPQDPEDFDDFEDEDGCPEPDNDQDTILDVDDGCPLNPEDFDNFEDGDGCPDPDNDRDGITDMADLCPNDPEDVDSFEDVDGCPDPDNDQDGILDVDDECPADPETLNGFQDEDGCPDRGLVNVTCEALEIEDRVYFETDSDVIQVRSYDLLDQIVGVLRARSDISLVSIEGHTDSRGSDSHNMDLSTRRAASVRRYLVDHGIQADRLLSLGYGEERPVASNDTADGRADNRRVEFLIIEQAGCQE